MYWFSGLLWLASGFVAARYVCYKNNHAMDSECVTTWVIASLLGPFALLGLKFKDD